MKLRLSIFLVGLLASLNLHAQAVLTKANNPTALDQSAAWSPTGVPGPADTALWSGTYSVGNASVGAGLSAATLRVTSPSVDIVLTAGTGALSVGSGGFDLASATRNLTVEAPVTISTNQSWTIAANRTLTLSGNVSVATARLVSKFGAGTLELSGTSNTFAGGLALSAGAVRVTRGNTSLSASDGASGWGGSTGTTLRLSGGLFSANAGRAIKQHLLLDGGSLTLVAGASRLSLASGANLTMSSGNITVPSTASFGVRLGGENGPALAGFAFTGVQSGGNFTVSRGGFGTSFSLGSNSSANTTYSLSGGTLAVLGNASDGALVLGSDTAGSGTTRFTLSGTGRLVVSGTGANTGILGANAEARQIFEFTGGTLAAGSINATQLRAPDASTSGVFVQSGGLLAPGDTATAGRTAITGGFLQRGGGLDIDIGGNAAATAFQHASGRHDQIAVTGATTLNGSLNVRLTGGFVPNAADTFVILTSNGTLDGAFTNVAFDRTVVAEGGVHGFTLVRSGNSVVLTNGRLLAPPSITLEPLDQSVPRDGSVTFSVAATGTAPIAYQWRKDGADLPGETGASLTLTNVAYSASGDYDVVLQNPDGTRTSRTARLAVVLPPPVIVTGPTSVIVNPGGNVTLTVNATGEGLVYQWRDNGVLLPGQTGASLTLSSLSTADTGRYDVIVSNTGGSVATAPALVVVNPSWVSPAALRYDLNGSVPALGAAVPDATGNTSGTLVGTVAPLSISGPTTAQGNAWDFTNANSHIRVASNPVTRSFGDIARTDGLTVAFWVRYLYTSSAQNNLRTLGLGGTIDVLTGSSFGRGNLKFRFGNDINIPLIELTSPTNATFTVLDGTWRHCVATLDFTSTTSNAKLYVDGVLRVTQSQAIQTPFTNASSNLILAARDTSSGTPASQARGAYDQFAFFNRALSAAEIAQLYSGGSVSNFSPEVTASVSRSPVPWPANRTTLAAAARDDGQPGALTYAWTQVSGPATATFTTPSAALTDVSFPQTGTYIFRVTVSDGAVTASSDVSVSVTTNTAPTVFASTPTPVVGPSTLAISLSGGATDDGLPGVLPLAYEWSQVSGPGTAAFGNTTTASTTATLPANTPGTYVFRLLVSDGALSSSTNVTVQSTGNLAPSVQAVSPRAFFAWNGAATAVPVEARMSDDGLPGPLSCSWSQVAGPGTATFMNPATATTNVTFSAPGIYQLRATASDGSLTATSDVWLQAAVPTPGASTPTSVAVLSATPPPFEHPRLFFTDADRPALQSAAATDPVASAAKARLITNVAATLDNPSNALGVAFSRLKTGDTSYNTRSVIRSGTASPDAMTGHASSGLYGLLAAASYVAWLDTETGSPRLRELGTALAAAAANHNTWWANEGGLAPDFYSDLAFCYDLLYDSMSESQRAVVRQAIARMIAGRTVYGATEPDYAFSTNWRTYHQHLILGALAIEGEPGFDAALLDTNRRAARRFLTKWGVTADGFNREGPGYFGFGMHIASLTTWALSRRGENFFATTRFYQSVQEFFSQMAPDDSGFMYGANDGPGWGNGPGTSSYYAILKAAYPDDPVIDHVTRQGISRLAGNQPLLTAIWARAPMAGMTTFAAVNAAKPMPLHVFSPQRGFGVARSTWDSDALQVDFENRFDSFALGHSHAVRNHFTLFALGREWIGGHGYHYTANDLKSTVLIDGIGQATTSLTSLAAAGLPQVTKWPPLPGRFLENVDQPLFSLFAGDARPSYTYSWANMDYSDPTRVPAGSIATPWRWRDLAYPGFAFPTAEIGDNTWADRVIRAESTLFNPVQRAFRSVLVLRGTRPYVLVLDDIQKDETARTYTWSANTVTNRGVVDMAIQPGATATDAVFFHTTNDTASGPRLLVRVLEGKGTAPGPIALDSTPLDYGSGPVAARRIQITRTNTTAPDFKVLLYPHLSGEALPVTSYDPSTGMLTITPPGGPSDVFRLVRQPDGRTRVASFARGGANAPTLSLPGDITASSVGVPTPVNFTINATDSSGNSLVPKVNPPSGFAFPVGTTPVTVSVADATGNTATGSFLVHVRPDAPAPALSSVITLAGPDNRASLSWAAVPGATAYTVRRATSPLGPFTTIAANITTTTFADATGGPAYYTVAAQAMETTGADSPVVAFVPPAAPWTLQTLGSISGGLPGGASISAGAFHLSDRNGDIANGATEAFTFLWLPWTGNGTLTARVRSFGNPGDTSAKVGLMFRESLLPGARQSFVYLLGSGSAAFGRKTSVNGTMTVSTLGGRAAPEWIRLTRSGTNYSAFVSDDGAVWTSVGSTSANTFSGNSHFAGIAIAARTAASEAFAMIDNVTFTGDNGPVFPPPSGLPAWRQVHFGTTLSSGNASDTFDPDGDGLANFVEYALDSLPTSAQSGAAPVAAFVSNRLSLSFLRARADVSYVVESSDDLIRWTHVVTNPGSVGEVVTVTDSADLAALATSRRFLRLRLTSP